MIIGRGAIASIIQDREGFIFFAAGESNRFPFTEERGRAEEREIQDIFINSPKSMFVYFSGLNIYYPDGGRSEYTKHKLRMEALVKGIFPDYCIIRLGSITWGDNPNTLINYIKNKIKETGDCEAKEVYRYLHTKEELQHWFGMIPTSGKHEMNVTGKMVWMPDLVKTLKLEHAGK